MKKIILIIGILVGTLISSNVMCQVIKVNVSETQKFYRYGEFKNPIDVINTPDVDYGLELRRLCHLTPPAQNRRKSF